MQLKKLEMVGFKSFANKTEIAFEPGVTCIVGPNGCGKSNVIDAVKWVLGTQSYKSVRGEEMMDVIFKGADGYGPAGYAEVSLTLDNSDHTLAIEFDEVTVTRRLHRDGVGEYEINKNACRLKDIRDLLYGTGIGSDNYSIIEQGKIDRLITSDPKARRLVFDEAAGISKYRARKKETELRLEKVSQDLFRMGDTVREVQRQLRSVRGQASRAAAYKRLQEEYRGKKSKVVRHEFIDLQAELAETTTAIDALEKRRADLETRLAAEKDDVTKLDAERAALDERHAALTNELSATASKEEFLKRTIESLESRRAELTSDRARAEESRDEALARLTTTREMMTGADQERAGLETEAAAKLSAIEDAKVRLAEAEAECRRLEGDIEAKKNERAELATKETEYKAQRLQVESERQALTARSSRVQAQAANVARELDELTAKLVAADLQRAGLEAEIAELKRRLEIEETEIANLRDELGILDQELSSLRTAKEARASRQSTLRELEMAYEGLGDGTRELLKAGLPGVRGTLADLIEANPEDVAVVEAVLGDAAGMVVVETSEQAKSAVEFMRAHGRATVVALDSCRPKMMTSRYTPGVESRGHEMVRCDDLVRPLVKSLLGDVVVVDGPEDAEALVDLWTTSATIVTRTGEIYDPRGPVTAGTKLGAPGLLSRRVELKRLEGEIEEYLKLIETKEARRSECQDLLRAGEIRVKLLRQQGYDKHVAHGDLVRSIEALSKRKSLAEEELSSAKAEAVQIEGQQAAMVDSAARLEKLLVELDGMRVQIAGEIASMEETRAKYAVGRTELQNELNALQVSKHGLEEKIRGVESRLSMFKADMAQQEEVVRRGEEQLADVEARMSSVAQEIERHRTDEEALAREVAERRAAVEQLATEREAASKKVNDADEKANATATEISGALAEQNQLAITKAQQEMTVQQAIDRAREELQIDLLTPATESIATESTENTENTATEHTENTETPATESTETTEPAAPAEPDWSLLSQECEDLRSRISNFGNVNTVALDELKELEEREKLMITQVEDLERTKGQLEDLIRRINKESKELFDRTLEFVREQFGGIFRRVFGGGKADILIQEEPGVEEMDRGLEVIARMPGREALPISMLSGGQKSLCAFSLVMALFKANPSPFCILDEADAPLDEANVEKYTNIVLEHVNETQFIVISHNKRTMAVADVLYGVTMEQQGVSKKVSVDLHGQNLEKLRARREELKRLRAEAAARKSAAMAEVRAAAQRQMDNEDATGAPAPEVQGPESSVQSQESAVAVAEVEKPKRKRKKAETTEGETPKEESPKDETPKGDGPAPTPETPA